MDSVDTVGDAPAGMPGYLASSHGSLWIASRARGR